LLLGFWIWGKKTYPWLDICLFQLSEEANDNAKDLLKQVSNEFGQKAL
jgi:hypothetical protein